MQGTLLVEFERMLDMKALSIIPVVKDSFYDDRRFEFGKIVCDTLEYGLKYYWCDIEMRVMQFIYMMEDNVDIDIDEYSYEREKKHLYSYSQWCIKDPKQRKNHLKAARGMAKRLITLYKNNNANKSLAELLASWMNDYFPVHHDSVDTRAVILYLQDELNKLGYEIKSIAPIILKKIN